jgi:hypothetical protein
MPPFFIVESEQGYCSFQQPEKSYARYQDDAPVERWYGLKII